MPTYADIGGWVISTIAGWSVVTADTGGLGTPISAHQNRGGTMSYYAYLGPLGEVGRDGLSFLASKDGFPIGTHGTLQEAMASLEWKGREKAPVSTLELAFPADERQPSAVSNPAPLLSARSVASFKRSVPSGG